MSCLFVATIMADDKQDELSEFVGKKCVAVLDKAVDTPSKASLLHTTTLGSCSVQLERVTAH